MKSIIVEKILRKISILSNHSRLTNDIERKLKLLANEVKLKKKGMPQHNKCVKQERSKT